MFCTLSWAYFTNVLFAWIRNYIQGTNGVTSIFCFFPHPSTNPCYSTLHWRHNDHDGVSNHQPHGCFLNRLLRRRSKKTSKLRVTGLCVGNSPGPVNSQHKGPVTRKTFPFDDVIMKSGSHFVKGIEHEWWDIETPKDFRLHCVLVCVMYFP